MASFLLQEQSTDLVASIYLAENAGLGFSSQPSYRPRGTLLGKDRCHPAKVISPIYLVTPNILQSVGNALEKLTGLDHDAEAPSGYTEHEAL
jgi:hypothetical protein